MCVSVVGLWWVEGKEREVGGGGGVWGGGVGGGGVGLGVCACNVYLVCQGVHGCVSWLHRSSPCTHTHHLLSTQVF